MSKEKKRELNWYQANDSEAMARRLQAEYPWLELRPRAAIEKK